MGFECDFASQLIFGHLLLSEDKFAYALLCLEYMDGWMDGWMVDLEQPSLYENVTS